MTAFGGGVMTAFVEECRQEWKRLGVPDSLAQEMATELESDLAEAEADGVSAVELLGESDPRRFAATWARERGLVSEPAPQARRRRVWPWILVAFVLVIFVLSWLALQTLGTTHSSSSPPVRITPAARFHLVRVPDLVGLKACTAARLARDAGLRVRHVPQGRCDAVVVVQMPAPGTALRRHGAVTLRLKG